MSEFDVDLAACRGRQKRFLASMQEAGVELAIVTSREHVQWLTGFYTGPMYQSSAAITAAGHVTLVVPATQEPKSVAADDVVLFEAQHLFTLRNDQREANSAVLLAVVSQRPARLGVEFSTFGTWLAQGFANAELVDLEPELFRLRRQKDADEVRMLRKSIAATAAMYARAREIVQPGINELEVYSELYRAGVKELGETLTYYGQDFQCNSRGGPPRDREAQGGELYILDLGAGFRGYFSDNCRAISVDRRPTDVQMQAWEQIQKVFRHIESSVKPGYSAKQLYEEAQAILDERLPWVFDHHLGHGVGLYPHEAPHLNRYWDDEFQEGELFTAEPALYHDDLRHGMRLEQNYLVTATGLELLTDFSLDLI
jgi:Xaa-Pro dipeptidase